MAEPVKTHNAKFAALWNAASREYERVSQGIADSIDHCIACLPPKSGERVLDVATGTGWTAAELRYLSFIRWQRESQQRLLRHSILAVGSVDGGSTVSSGNHGLRRIFRDFQEVGAGATAVHWRVPRISAHSSSTASNTAGGMRG